LTAPLSRYFPKILYAVSTGPFFQKYVSLPQVNDSVDPFIRGQSKFYPFFKNTIGAMDGTHINCCPSSTD
jgi:hypothetical protein